MSTYESAYKSLLQGVSQQLPDERLPGQLTAQTNMVSDPVTNLRRRPGIVYRASWDWTGADAAHTLGWFTDLAGSRVHVLVNTNTGNIRIFNEEFVQEASLDAGSYLVNSDPNKIRATSVGNEFFLCNTGIIPTMTFGTSAQANKGFFYVVAGAFSKSYDLTLTYSGGASVSVSHLTPSGTGSGDAALATPEYVASQLVAKLLLADSALVIDRVGPYVFLSRPGSAVLSIATSAGTGYLITSRGGSVPAAGNLPAQLPLAANDYIVRVGSGRSPQYYQYKAAEVEWVECGATGSPTQISNVPIGIVWSETSNSWELNTAVFDGRGAGDDESNPAHEWMRFGITGMGTYQGRLVLMSGPMVSLSASNAPRRFFRTTVSSIISSDPIEVGAGMNSAAAYEWAIPFQKDLVIFSRAYQAVIPSGNTAITPATATVVPTSTHEVDTTSSPITLGRTLLYCKPRSEDFFGAMEMIPSNYTDSQYVSQDSTPHLPKYMGGRCRFAVASGVASLALLAPTGDTHSVIVHEYHWDADTKVQQAWHQWLFEYPLATAYFASDVIMHVFVQNGTAVIGSVDPRAGALNAASERRPFLDLNVSTTIVDHEVTLPAWLLDFDPDAGNKVQLVMLTGALAGERVGATYNGDGTMTTVLSHPSGTVGIGIPYYSGFIPSPPVVRDYKENVLHSGKATLHRFMVGTRNSSEFMVSVMDDYSEADEFGVPTLTWSSPELTLGRGLYANAAMSIVPCRTDLRSTLMEVSTEGTGELNVTSLEYVAKFHPKITRR